MAVLDIQRFRGDTDPAIFNISKQGKTLDITGSTFKLSVSTVSSPVTAVYIMQLIGVVEGPLGRVSFSPTALEADVVGNYYYDVEMTTGTVVKTIVSGKFKMLQDITK